MLNVTLTRLTNPDQPIKAIKSLRAVACPTPNSGRTDLGLREAKEVIDMLRGFQRAPGPVTVAVKSTEGLSEAFDFVASPIQPEGIDRALVLDALIDAIAIMNPAQAAEFQAGGAFRAARAAVTR